MYLDNGTQKSLTYIPNDVKFVVVGCLTKNLGGKISISSNGLNADMTTYITGSRKNAANRRRIIKIATFPAVERFTLSLNIRIFGNFI